MTNRRNFIKNTGALALGSLVLPKAYALSGRIAALPQPGLQLFTFFNVIDNDVPGTLQKIAEVGYKNIESAFSRKGGYYGMKPKAFATLLKGFGMSWKAHHVIGAPFRIPAGAKPPAGPDGKPVTIPPMRNLRDNYKELIDEAAEGGVEYIVCASTPIGTGEEVKNSISILNKSGEYAKSVGLQFVYHNHDAEFRQVEGKIPYDLFLSETSPEVVKMELDLAWVIKGGADPVELFKKHPGRFPLWHVKDLDAERKKVQAVGTGTIDFKRIFTYAEASGLKYYFIEHDMPENPFQSIQTSINNIAKMV